MRRLVAILALVLLVGDTSGVLVAAADEACGQACPGDAPETNCAPTSDECACCSLPRVVIRPSVVDLIEVAPRGIPQGPSDAAPLTADPAAIFHVPKRVLA